MTLYAGKGIIAKAEDAGCVLTASLLLSNADRMGDTMDRSEDERHIESFSGWHHRITFPSGAVTPGRYDPGDLFERLKLGDLTGKRVLDLGARDGYFAFGCERLGAEVLALDHCDPEHTGFPVAKRILGSQVEYLKANVYDLPALDLGTFDVVLFLGVIYHLRHPLLALDQIRRVCHGTVYVESLVADHSFFRRFMEPSDLSTGDPGLTDLPVAQFLSRDLLHADWTNRWNPNLCCLKALVDDACFDVTTTQTWGDRALVTAQASMDPVRAQWNDIDSGNWSYCPTPRKDG